jgi:hypothetical protein
VTKSKAKQIAEEPKVLTKNPSDKETGKAPSPDHGLTRQPPNERSGGLKKSGASANLRKDDEVMQDSGENKSNGEDSPVKDLSSSPAQRILHKDSESDDPGVPVEEDEYNQHQTFDMN